MKENLRLLAVMAHPDDESMGAGGTLAKYAAEGVETYLITATRGEHGWFGAPDDYPGPHALGQIREKELAAAAGVLGLKEVTLLGYIDGELDRADPQEVIAQLARHIRRIRPHVVITFDPNGYYGHPDHIAISQFAASAVLAAASGGGDRNGGRAPHTVSKLYYMVETAEQQKSYEAAFGDLVMEIDGVERRSVAWEPWAVTTSIDTRAYWRQAFEAVTQHCSQLPGYQALLDLPESYHAELWGTLHYYRAISLVNGGRKLEADLFAGLRREEKVNG